MSARAKASPRILGFGFDPDQSPSHFTVWLGPRDIYFSEHSVWTGDLQGDVQTFAQGGDHVLRAQLDRARWDDIAEPLEAELNSRLREMDLPPGKWRGERVPLPRLFGKEVVLLVWAIEDADPGLVPVAIINWLGLRPEERWWLYTMTAAASGHITDRGRGWRKAVRYALTENPTSQIRPVDRESRMLLRSDERGQLGFVEAPATARRARKRR